MRVSSPRIRKSIFFPNLRAVMRTRRGSSAKIRDAETMRMPKTCSCRLLIATRMCWLSVRARLKSVFACCSKAALDESNASAHAATGEHSAAASSLRVNFCNCAIIWRWPRSPSNIS